MVENSNAKITFWTVAASIVVAIIAAFSGYLVGQLNATSQLKIAQSETSAQMVELVIGMLMSEPERDSDGELVDGERVLRNWAIETLNAYALVPLAQEAKAVLLERPLLSGGGGSSGSWDTVPPSSDENSTQLEFQARSAIEGSVNVYRIIDGQKSLIYETELNTSESFRLPFENSLPLIVEWPLVDGVCNQLIVSIGEVTVEIKPNGRIVGGGYAGTYKDSATHALVLEDLQLCQLNL